MFKFKFMFKFIHIHSIKNKMGFLTDHGANTKEEIHDNDDTT